MVSEEARATEYRRKMIARYENKKRREAALKGSDSDYARVYTAWAPLLPDDGWDPPLYEEDEK